MPLLVWIAVSVVLLASTAGAAYVFLRLRNFWRTFKSFTSAVNGAVRDLTGAGERLARNMETFGSGTPELDSSVERLRHSLARAAVLRAALDDARDSFGRLTAVYPRK